MPDFITIAAYTNIVNARIAKSVLDQHGIAAIIANEHIADMNLPGVAGVSGIELRVAASDADAAAPLVTDESAAHEGRSACPRCGSNRTKRRRNVLLGVLMDILGLSTKKMNRQWRCNACGNDWELNTDQ